MWVHSRSRRQYVICTPMLEMVVSDRIVGTVDPHQQEMFWVVMEIFERRGMLSMLAFCK